MVSTLIAVLALVVSGAALLVAWSQLVLQRDTAGGRGVLFTINRPMRKIHRTESGDRITEGYRIRVRLVGNDRYEVGLHLERGGQALNGDDLDRLGIERPPTLLHRWSCQDQPLRWDFDLDPERAENMYCVLLWVSPFGEGVRIDGFRQLLRGAGQVQDMEQWHWFRFFAARRRFESWGSQHGPEWFRRWAGHPRRLGEWRKYGKRELQPGQSPTTWGSLPPRRRWWGRRAARLTGGEDR